MRFSVLAALCASVGAVPFVARQNAATPDQIAQLAPDLGGFPNTDPNSGGDCSGPSQNGLIPKVPCACPPLRDAYIKALTANIQAGHAVNNTVVNISFPTGDSVQDKHGRITAAIITLQNLNGPGKGCPGVSTTLGLQSKNLDKCGDFQCDGNPPAASSPPPAVSSPASSAASSSDPASVAPAPAATTSSAVDAAGTTPVVPPQAAPTQAAVGVPNGPSTITVTIHTVITSFVTVTAGQTATPTPDVAAVTTTSSEATSTGAAATSTSAAEPASTTAVASDGNTVLTRELLDQLAPQLGSQPNNNPNRFGDCEGVIQPGQSVPPHVPCACPPTRDVFIDQLFANLQVGHAVHNPSVKISFPTGNSKADQHARITAGTITLQNLNGPGKGCPNVSTTFAAQSNAIGN